MVALIHFLWRVLFLVLIARYQHVGETIRTVLYILLIVFLVGFLISQTFLLIQENRVSKGETPIVIRNQVIATLLTVGIPVKDIKEARRAFALIIVLVAFFAISYHPAFYS